MANMQDNRSAFEDQWRDAFEDAEMTPSEGLWKNIDNQLTMQESGKYRRGFIFYRSLAAACVVCLLGLGYYVLQDSLEESRQLIGQNAEQESPQAEESRADQPRAEESRAEEPRADEQVASPEESNSPAAGQNDAYRQPTETGESTANHLAMQKPDSKEEAAPEDKQKRSARKSVADNAAGNNTQNNSFLQAPQSENVQNAVVFTESQSASLALPAYLASLGPVTRNEEKVNWTEKIDRLYRVPQAVKKEEKEKQEKSLFAGINLATNYFDPNFSQGGRGTFSSADAPMTDAFVNRQLSQSAISTAETYSSAGVSNGLENRPQLSISYGVDVGMMISEHLSLESGIDYGRMNSSTSTSLVAEDFSQGERIPLLVSNALEVQNSNVRTQFTSDAQNLTNSFEIISVPLKLGYNLQFNKININLSSGVAANFFLNNRLSDESGQLSTVNLGAGSVNSPYRPLYYSAVISGGLNYMLTQNYAVSVAPNYNFALSDLTESGYNFSSQPNNFGVDFGIRYIFNK